MKKEITNPIKEGFLPILDVIIPNNKDEKWVFGTFFFIYACFSVLFFRKYGNDFPDVELLNYDICYWQYNFSKALTLPFNGGIKHPLLTAIFYPLNILVYIAKLLSGDLFLHNLAIMLFFNAIAALSIMIIYKYAVNLIRIPKIQALFLCTMFALFAHVLLLSFIPETFQLSMLGLLLVVYLTTDSLLNGRKIPLITNILLFVYATGVTLSNGLKCVIAQLFQKGNFKDKRKSILLSGLITAILLFLSFCVNYIVKTEVPEPNITEFIFSGEIAVAYELFFEPILFHHNYSFWGLGQEVFAYNTIFPIMVNLVFYAVILCAVLANIRKQCVWLLLSFFGIDVFIHIICGFGIADPYIYCLHWLFIFPLLIGWLYKEIRNKRTKMGLNILLLLLIVSLAVNNIPRIVELIY